MVSDAQKKASAKWDKENMVVLACKVKRETAEQFKAACAAQGTTSNAVLQQAVKAYLEEHPAPEQPHTAGNAPDDDTEARRAVRLGRMLNDARPRQTGRRTVPARN